MNFLAELANDARGLMLLKDWLGDSGEVVPRTKSEHRASICAGGYMGMPCPQNVEPNWWNRVKSSIADVMCEELSLKHRFKIETTKDDALHVCRACGCCVKLKVHTPIDHIKKHVTQAALDNMPNYCWQKTEILSKIENEN